VHHDAERFARLRKLAFFTEFEDVDLWEVMRICAWRKVGSDLGLMREGDLDQRFGIVLEGKVELSIGGRRVLEVGPGEVFGEQAWLDQLEHKQLLSAVSLDELSYLEVNPAALALASEEVLERFRRQLGTVAVRRLAAVSRQAAEHAPAAVRAVRAAPVVHDLQIVDY